MEEKNLNEVPLVYAGNLPWFHTAFLGNVFIKSTVCNVKNTYIKEIYKKMFICKLIIAGNKLVQSYNS